MKTKITLIIFLSIATILSSAEPVIGLWKSIDDDTGLPKSVTLIYESNGKIYGRIMAIFDDEGQPLDSIMNPEKTAENIENEPYYSGLDIIWEMEEKNRKWSRGKIIDPKPAMIYSCDMWIDDGNLIVRGKIGPFGRNQIWIPASIFHDLPDDFVVPSNLIPIIPEAKK